MGFLILDTARAPEGDLVTAGNVHCATFAKLPHSLLASVFDLLIALKFLNVSVYSRVHDGQREPLDPPMPKPMSNR